MIPTWLAHGTEYMQLRMQREFSYFPFFCFCFVEENTRIMYEQTKSMLNAYDDAMTHAKWECDNGQMQERYVHYDAEEMFMRCMI